MADNIYVSKVDEVYLKVDCSDSGIERELAEYFTFYVPGYQFTPQYKSKLWDGKIRLYNRTNHSLYYGLTGYIAKFAKEREYPLYFGEDVLLTDNFSIEEAKEFIKTLNLKLEPRDYQIDAFVHAIRNRRLLCLSPTASGKSLIAYLICRYLLRHNKSGLILVPTTSLVEQLYSDFSNYSNDTDSNISRSNDDEFQIKAAVHKIYSGHEKNTDKPIVISTWQSLYKFPESYFSRFDFVIGDECHLYKAKSLTSIMTKLKRTKYRIGMTGTLDGTKTHRLVLEGLFGPVRKVVTTNQLIERKELSNFQIKCLVLKYNSESVKKVRNLAYIDEIKFLISHDARNRFIRNLALSLNENTLILFQFVEDHGKILHKLIEEKANERKVYFVYGKTETETREEIRSIMERESGSIVVASYGVFSTGINIRNLHNIIFASPSKSRVRNLQSIGRGLRTHDSKKVATLYDIADDLKSGKKMNYTYKHYMDRLAIYKDEKFPFKVYSIDLESST